MSIIDRVIAFIKSSSGPSERATERDGLLSYAGEWHAVALGGGLGVYAALTQDPQLMVALLGLSLGLGSAGEARRQLRKALSKIGGDGESSGLGQVVREPWYSAGAGLAGWLIGGGVTRVSELVDVITALV